MHKNSVCQYDLERFQAVHKGTTFARMLTVKDTYLPGCFGDRNRDGQNFSESFFDKNVARISSR